MNPDRRVYPQVKQHPNGNDDDHSYPHDKESWTVTGICDCEVSSASEAFFMHFKIALKNISLPALWTFTI